QLAPLAPTYGLVIGDHAGVSQAFAWDVPSAALRPLATRASGVPFALLSPDSRYVYFLNDDNGDEMGHWVRVPYEGGALEDLTPNWRAYWSAGVAIRASPLTISRACNRLAFNMANDDGYHLCCIDLKPDGALGTPRILYTSKQLLQNGSLLSHDGEVAVVVS